MRQRSFFSIEHNVGLFFTSCLDENAVFEISIIAKQSGESQPGNVLSSKHSTFVAHKIKSFSCSNLTAAASFYVPGIIASEDLAEKNQASVSL